MIDAVFGLNGEPLRLCADSYYEGDSWEVDTLGKSGLQPRAKSAAEPVESGFLRVFDQNSSDVRETFAVDR